jgi:hypothetical protein
VASPFEQIAAQGMQGKQRRRISPFRLLRRLVVLAFAVIQAILVARILLDLGVIAAEGGISGFIITSSDALAAPVQGVGNGLGGMFGGAGGLGGVAGDGFNPVMVAALVGWTLVEGLVMRVVTKFAAV